MPINTPTQKPTQGRLFMWGKEDVTWGVPPAGGTGHNILAESITDFTSDDQRDLYAANEYTGAMSGQIGSDELTHYVQGTLTSPFRAHGVTAQALANLMGNQTYAPVGTATPYTHTMVTAPYTNRCNTLSCWWQATRDAASVAPYTKLYRGTTVTSVAFTFGPGGALDTSVSLWTQWPIDGVPAAIDNYVGNDAVYTITRTLGYQGSFSIYGSSGVVYQPRILSGTLTLTRESEAVYAADSQTIVDIALGPLGMTGSFVFQFDGYGTQSTSGPTIAKDYYDYKPVGSATNPNVIKWTDTDGNYVQLTSHFWKWNPFTLDYSGQFVKGNGTFTAFNEPSLVMSATAVLSAVKQLKLSNNIATAMIGA